MISQEIKARLFGRDICDIATVGSLPLFTRQALNNISDRESQKSIQRPHPVRVAFCQVIVKRQDMHAESGQRTQADDHSRRQSLSFASLHFDALAVVHRECGEHLDIVGPHRHRSLGNFPDNRESLHGEMFLRSSA